MNLEELNNIQREAVTTTKGPVLVMAGAGSGKTRLLTNRVAYLILEEKVAPSKIVAITFTNKAAKEMRDRVYKLIGRTAYDIQISTFHSFGVKILKENYELLKYDKNFTILDSDDSLSIIKKIIKEKNLDPKVVNPKGIKSRISSAKNELVDPISYQKYCNNNYDEMVQEIYIKYEDKLRKNNAVDFDDLLILPIKLFKEFPNVLKKYQEQYKYVLVDEYQDTNEAQYILTKMISALYKNIFVVGDSDQAIYAWRGANYKNIMNFEKDYHNSKVILLEENYRSTQNILKAANSVIQNNKLRKDKNLWSSKDDGNKIIYKRTYDERDEAHYVVSEIKELISNDISLDEIAVLYRTNAQSRSLEEAFISDKINYRIVGSIYFYSRREIKDLISYLKLIHNEKDESSLLRVINTPKRGIGTKAIENIVARSNERGVSAYESLMSEKELAFKQVIEDIKEYSKNHTITEIIEYTLEKSGLKAELVAERTLESEIRLENIEEFKSISITYEKESLNPSLEEFLMEITLVADMSEHQEAIEKVSLMTIHSVKGLEFDNIFIVGLEEGILPHATAMFESNELEEERRLMYVGITRARKKLFLVNARRRTLFGKESTNPPSRFIKEIDEDLIETTEKKEFSQEEQYKSTIDLKPGNRINHDKYEEGVVISVEGDIITVAFSQKHGIKKLLKNHKSITKI